MIPNIKLRDFDLRPFGTQQAISSLRKYFAIMETQMEQVFRMERTAFEATRLQDDDEVEISVFHQQLGFLEDAFDKELFPTMRYSFVVFIHTILETHLQAFCNDLKGELKLAIALSDLRGSPIDQANIYLSKIAGLSISSFTEWQHLRTLQKIRDCIVHVHGYVNNGSSKRNAFLRCMANRNKGVTLNDDSRLILTKEFCEQQLTYLDDFFRAIFGAAGWKPFPER